MKYENETWTMKKSMEKKPDVAGRRGLNVK